MGSWRGQGWGDGSGKSGDGHQKSWEFCRDAIEAGAPRAADVGRALCPPRHGGDKPRPTEAGCTRDPPSRALQRDEKPASSQFSVGGRRRLAAPKGRYSIAQGTALGLRDDNMGALKGRHFPGGGAPSGLRNSPDSIPRALPWAIALRPFGASNPPLQTHWKQRGTRNYFPSNSSACASALLAVRSPSMRASSLTRAFRLA